MLASNSGRHAFTSLSQVLEALWRVFVLPLVNTPSYFLMNFVGMGGESMKLDITRHKYEVELVVEGDMILYLPGSFAIYNYNRLLFQSYYTTGTMSQKGNIQSPAVRRLS